MKTRFVIALIFAGLTAAVSAQNVNQSQWQKNHPRRVEVNQRLKHENKRINKKVNEGSMSQAEATRLKAKERKILREERLMASRNGGHITKQQQKKLNRQENRLSRQIGR